MSRSGRCCLGTAGTLVLITSRHLTALEDSEVISLDTLPPDDAAALLVRLAARPDLAPGDQAAREITRLCGNLPLALGMLARQLHHHPAWTAAHLAADLAAARDRLALMQAENLLLTAAFDLSYQDLTLDRQQFYDVSGSTLAPILTTMPQLPSTAVTSQRPDATLQAFTITTSSPNPPAAAIACTT